MNIYGNVIDIYIYLNICIFVNLYIGRVKVCKDWEWLFIFDKIDFYVRDFFYWFLMFIKKKLLFKKWIIEVCDFSSEFVFWMFICIFMF